MVEIDKIVEASTANLSADVKGVVSDVLGEMESGQGSVSDGSGDSGNPVDDSGDASQPPSALTKRHYNLNNEGLPENLPYDNNTFAGIYWLPWDHKTYYEYIAEHVILFTGWNTYDKIHVADQEGRDLFGAGNAMTNYYGFNGRRKIYISYGGGNNNVILSEVHLRKILDEDLDRIKEDYDGVCLDIEVVRDYNQESYLRTLGELLSAIKKHELISFVTVSWTRPYNVCEESGDYSIECGGDNHKFKLGGQIMDFLIQNPDLDYLSPQMYGTGHETNDEDSHFHVPYLNQVWGYDKL